jgi:hypothetical protein
MSHHNEITWPKEDKEDKEAQRKKNRQKKIQRDRK